MQPFHFWYIYFSNGKSGLLVDFVKFPNEAYVRAAIFSPQKNAVFESEHLPLNHKTFAGREGALPVRIGSAELSSEHASGKAGPIEFDLKMIRNSVQIRYTPRIITWLTGIPQVFSHIGTSFTGTVKLDGELLNYEKILGVYTFYWMKELTSWQWHVISAINSDDNLFSLEFVVARFLGGWRATGFLKYAGREYFLEGVWDTLFRVQVIKTGSEEPIGRHYVLKLNCGDRSFLIEGFAPNEKFVLLHSGYGGNIHTTLLGDCTVTEYKRDQKGAWSIESKGQARGNCLLESKEAAA